MNKKIGKPWNKKLRNLLECYTAKGVYFDTKKKVKLLSDDRLKLTVKVLPMTNVAGIMKYKDDVRRALKLSLLEVIIDHDTIYFILSKERLTNNYGILSLMKKPEYSEAKGTMELVHAVGLDMLGNPVFSDLAKQTHIVVSGTTGSGKSTALKVFLLGMLAYSPQEVNLLIADRANDLSQFAGIPHLSCRIIKDSDTFLAAMLALCDEMKRRIALKGTEHFDQLPAIVCVADEFNALIGGLMDRIKIKLAAATITEILRMGRHARIHLVFAAHNPTKANMQIDTSDFPVKMAFQVSKLHNSLAAIDEGGAEKLEGCGDMLYKAEGKVQHLHCYFATAKEIEDVVHYIRTHTMQVFMDNTEISPRGHYGFTISNEDLQRKAAEISGGDEHMAFPSNASNRWSKQSADDLKFAKVIVWTLNQNEISCNQISEGFNVGWRRANRFIMRMSELGIVGDLDAKLPRKVLLHSMEELPQETIELLMRNGLYKNADSLAFSAELADY